MVYLSILVLIALAVAYYACSRAIEASNKIEQLTFRMEEIETEAWSAFCRDAPSKADMKLVRPRKTPSKPSPKKPS